MLRTLVIGSLFILLWGNVLSAQSSINDLRFRVLDFEDGLSHRNVFNIAQDSVGYLWLGTINGLNRFDGYSFRTQNSHVAEGALPTDAVTSLAYQGDKLFLGQPDFLTIVDPDKGTTQALKITSGEIVRRAAIVPQQLLPLADGSCLLLNFYEATGQIKLDYFHPDNGLSTVKTLQGNYHNRPLVEWAEQRFLAAGPNEIWQLDTNGQHLTTLHTPLRNTRIVQFFPQEDQLWCLFEDGRIYVYDKNGDWLPHPENAYLRQQFSVAPLAFYREENGSLWIGGRGKLLHFDAVTERWTDYDDSIRDLTKNTTTFRQFFVDHSGTIWIASDFGLIQMTRSNRLFDLYLNGGSEYCSNVFCSTRGITEDEEGLIYISYYNSMHVYDPGTDGLRPLFPTNDYFNYPFGLAYYKQALFTGNGRRIDLQSMQVDSLLSQAGEDQGAVVVSPQGELWVGYDHQLYRWDEPSGDLLPYSWPTLDSIGGAISYLLFDESGKKLFVGTLDNGVFVLDLPRQKMQHLADDTQGGPLAHPKINAILKTNSGELWVGSGKGLHRFSSALELKAIYQEKDGLANDFINGVLSEGDSVLWLSTDRGLIRWSVAAEAGVTYTRDDGLAANEFNRMSFYKSRTGRMYFGGLNGVVAFTPSNQLTQVKRDQQVAPMMFTRFSHYHAPSDSLIMVESGLQPQDTFLLHPQDRVFNLEFALADFRSPAQNEYSYYLEGYESNWSPPTKAHSVRYNGVPPGTYTFHARGKSLQGGWSPNELAVHIVIERPFYRNIWFWVGLGLLTLALMFLWYRYRVYRYKQQQAELARQVKERTRDLEIEKQKSEDLLLNILPAEAAKELKEKGFATARRHNHVTVMFSDFVDFTRLSEMMEPEDLVAEIDTCFRAFDEIVERHGLEKIKTVGDAYLCVGGIFIPEEDEAVQVVKAALEMQEFLAGEAIMRELNGAPAFHARIGIHTGPVVAGIVGIKKFAYDIWGDTVNLASRMETHSQAGRVNLSETTYRLIEDHVRCVPNGQYAAHDTVMDMFLVEEYVG